VKGIFPSAVIAGLCIASAAPAAPVPGTQAATLPQHPGIYRFMIGDAKVTALSDGTAAQDYHALLKGITPAKTDAALSYSFELNPVQTSINAFLVELGGRHILIDTGTGSLFGKQTAGRLIGALAEAGITPDQIDDILLTHVHADHMGGLVQGGKVMFPKAIVHFGKPDMAFFVDPVVRGQPHGNAELSKMATDMLKPYVDAAKVATFSAVTEIVPGLTAIPHPGHTPGSAFYALESKGQRIVFVGDIVHAAAVQFGQPEVSIAYDAEPALAIAVRKRAFAEYAANRTLIAAPHLSFPGVGHVRMAGSAYEWVPIEYADWPNK